jgi:uncharacterized protein (DUF1015 family)
MLPGRRCASIGAVPRFEPFRAVRYAPQAQLAEVTAPPYDVLTPEQRDSFARRHPHNVVHIDVPRDADGRADYPLAGGLFREWRAGGVLVTDAVPTLSIYRMTFLGRDGQPRTATGVMGGLEVLAPGEGDVLPHEQTTPKDRTDRLELTRSTEANLSPIWGLSLASGITTLLADPGEPVGAFVDEAGVEHRVERVTDPSRISQIAALVGSAPVVIADGHHRYDVARVYRDERRGAQGEHGPWDLTLAFVVELAEDQLTVEPIHRLLSGLAPGWDDVLDQWFERAPLDGLGHETRGALDARDGLALVYADGRGEVLVPRPDAFADVDDLDTARVAHALASVPHQVRYEPDVDVVLHELAARRADAAILVRPVTVAAIERLARDRSLMPPKSTFFTPKLRTGLGFRPLAE